MNKKITCIFLGAMMILVGCQKTSDVVTRQDEFVSPSNVVGTENTTPKNNIKVIYKGDTCAWDISQAELAELINSNLPDPYEKVTRLHTDEDRMWSNNGETWQFVIDNCISVTNATLAGRAAEITLSAYADSDEMAFENAVFIEAAISAFHPEAVDYITYETNLYNENTDAIDGNGLPVYPKIVYGDCIYEYQNDNNKFVISVFNDGDGTNLDNKGVIKPE